MRFLAHRVHGDGRCSPSPNPEASCPRDHTHRWRFSAPSATFSPRTANPHSVWICTLLSFRSALCRSVHVAGCLGLHSLGTAPVLSVPPGWWVCGLPLHPASCEPRCYLRPRWLEVFAGSGGRLPAVALFCLHAELQRAGCLPLLPC